MKTPIRVIDKKKNKIVPTIFPNPQKDSIVDQFAGIFEKYGKISNCYKYFLDHFSSHCKKALTILQFCEK